MGISLGCSASGERLVTAARDGDLEEAQALLQCNPRLAKYSTFGARNSPLHFAAMQGHNEIVTLLLEHGVDVDTRKYCGQTALMQSCRHGHWEVVQTLILYKANVGKSDYLNGLTALHFAAASGQTRCLRLLVADYVPSIPNFWNERNQSQHASRSATEDSHTDSFSLRTSLYKLVNKTSDGGLTPLHMACLNGHTDCVHLLLDLGADVSALTSHYDTTINMIGQGSSPLHYAACGGSTQCCQILISRGANRLARNCNGWTSQQVAQVWGRHWLEGLLSPHSECTIPTFGPSPFLALPLMSIIQIARECGLGDMNVLASGMDSCVVCLEKVCTVAAEGCGHELCTRCALYLCSSNTGTVVSDPPGSVPCPLCRHGIVSFTKLPSAAPLKDLARSSTTLGLCTTCTVEESETIFTSEFTNKRSRVSPVSPVFRTVTCPGFTTMNLPCGKYDGHIPGYNPEIQAGRHSTSWPEPELPAPAGVPDPSTNNRGATTTPRSLSVPASRSKSPKRGWLLDLVTWKHSLNTNSSKPVHRSGKCGKKHTLL